MTLKFEVGPDGRIQAGESARDRQGREIISGKREDVTKGVLDAATESMFVMYGLRGASKTLTRVLDLEDGRQLLLSLSIREADQ